MTDKNMLLRSSGNAVNWLEAFWSNILVKSNAFMYECMYVCMYIYKEEENAYNTWGGERVYAKVFHLVNDTTWFCHWPDDGFFCLWSGKKNIAKLLARFFSLFFPFNQHFLEWALKWLAFFVSIKDTHASAIVIVCVLARQKNIYNWIFFFKL